MTASANPRWFTVLIYSAQFFFGGWFLFHGLNHFVHFFPQPPGGSPITSEVIHGLIKSGIFDWVKGAEILIGIMLLLNRFVPVAAVMAVPISFVIAYLNIAIEHDVMVTRSLLVFFGIMGMNGLILLGHLDCLLPLLKGGNIGPSIGGLRKFVGAEGDVEQAPGISLLWHIAAILLGIGLPVYLTLSTLPKPGEPGYAAPAATSVTK
jgi:uncharacterized membrane protein YphA (DoxX/SURF4 family)